MSRKQPILKLAGSYVATLLFMFVTTPQELPSVLLIVPFIFLFLSIYFTVMEIVGFLRNKDGNTVFGIQIRRPRGVAALIAGLPVLLLVLQSIGQLTFWDVLTVVAIFVIAYVYVLRSAVGFTNR